jgi:hypothetical protein
MQCYTSPSSTLNDWRRRNHYSVDNIFKPSETCSRTCKSVESPARANHDFPVSHSVVYSVISAGHSVSMMMDNKQHYFLVRREQYHIKMKRWRAYHVSTTAIVRTHWFLCFLNFWISSTLVHMLQLTLEGKNIHHTAFASLSYLHVRICNHRNKW